MKKTALHAQHLALDAKMVDFAGWHMPIQYSSITEEHEAVRNKAGIFDVSHMGEIYIVGTEATDLVDKLFTNRVRAMMAKQILYGMMCYEDGGTVDDLLVYKINEEHYLLVVNASNIDKDFDWINKQNTFDCEVLNKSDETSEVAIQGPLAESMVQKLTDYNLEELKFFMFDDIELASRPFLISRTGYTGEDGFEIYGDHRDIQMLFETLLEQNDDLSPCGLGCRDTLRFEVALPLYGNELSKEITPVEAVLNFALALDKGDFIGKDALVKQKEGGLTRRVMGLTLEGKGILRHGYEVYSGDTLVGHVTTGYKSITTGESVAMALLDKPNDKIGTQLTVKVRNRTLDVTVRNKKFYSKNTK